MSTPEQLGYSETDGIVTVRMTRDDFGFLMMCLGVASANPDFRQLAMQIANYLNLGRPAKEWRPYEVSDEVNA